MKKEIQLAHKIEVKIRKKRVVKDDEEYGFEPELYEGGPPKKKRVMKDELYEGGPPKKSSKKSQVIKKTEPKPPKVMNKTKTTKNVTKTDDFDVNETKNKKTQKKKNK